MCRRRARGVRCARVIAAVACTGLLHACCSTDLASARSAVNWPRVASEVRPDPQTEARVSALLSQLTLERKVAQMVQAEIRSVTPEDVRTYRLGSILNGG